MIDRKICPSIKELGALSIIKAQKSALKNGLPLYTINAGSQDLVKIEWVFDAGSRFEKQTLSALTTCVLLKEGSSKFTSEQFAEAIDYYGVFFETDCNKDKSYLALYSLNKHLEKVLPVVEDAIKNAVFPDHELDVYKQNSKQKLLVNNQKVDFIARNHFADLLFGSEHAYGKILRAEHYDGLKGDDIHAFYKNFYTASNCKLIVSGKVEEKSLHMLQDLFGQDDWTRTTEYTLPNLNPVNNSVRTHYIEKQDAFQSAIRIGRVLFNRTHPDFMGMMVLNTLLGGYFGSRLMSNIREDKGYTYGIGSGIVSMQQGGYFVISTEVGAEVCEPALKEIYFEIQKLREEKVGAEELELVKNYLLGTFLRSIDGPFALSDKFLSILEYDLDYDYFERYLTLIRNITAEDIWVLANKYLQEKDLIELVVGKK